MRWVACTIGLALVLAPLRSHARNACPESTEVVIWAAPRVPIVEQPLRVLAIARTGPPGAVAITGPDGKRMDVEVVSRGGPPWSLAATVGTPGRGAYRIEVRREGTLLGCRLVDVAAAGERRPAARGPAGWDATTEALYSAWIEALFDTPPEEPLSLPALHEVLRDPERNFLHDYLGLGEDEAGPRALTLTPDCADLPYVLRAYFGWKLGLPVGYRPCSRGSASAAPRCGGLTIVDGQASGGDPIAHFRQVVRRLADGVHSGSARTALDDDATDFYPVALTREALRPGVVFADPYGHTLLLVKWVPQTSDHSGLLLAVDAQPDNSVARKRFWEGTFLFASNTPSAGPGFKAFRPLLRDGPTQALRVLLNSNLAGDPRFAPFSDAQASLSADAFYARMSALINPHGLAPVRAYEDTLDALVEQIETRVGSVDNGERHMRATGGAVVPMPEGARIFETIGPWEDYATPSRDLRLLIAMDVLTALPERVARYPDLYVLDGRPPADVRAELEGLHARRIRERTVTYTRSDGSPWQLTVGDLLDRRAALEMAYNPNDCVEIRWGAPEGTPEAAPCRRHAPAVQRARMVEYRPWFHETRRPPRE